MFLARMCILPMFEYYNRNLCCFFPKILYFSIFINLMGGQTWIAISMQYQLIKMHSYIAKQNLCLQLECKNIQTEYLFVQLWALKA